MNRWRRCKQIKYTAKIYGKDIYADSMAELKRQASIIANDMRQTVDQMTVFHYLFGSAKYIRINRKSPDGAFAPGKWK